MKRSKRAQPGMSACTPRAHTHPFPAPQAFPWSPRGPSPTPAALRTSRAQYPRVQLPVSRSSAKMEARIWSIDRSERTLTAHAERTQGRALRYRSPTRPRPSLHLTYWHLREVRPPPPTLSPTPPHRRQEDSDSPTKVPSRRVAPARERHGPGRPLAPPLPGPYGASAPARRGRRPRTNRAVARL